MKYSKLIQRRSINSAGSIATKTRDNKNTDIYRVQNMTTTSQVIDNTMTGDYGKWKECQVQIYYVNVGPIKDSRADCEFNWQL